MSEYKKKITNSIKIIKDVMSTYQKPYVAFSGGKDSTVMLFLALQVNPDVYVLHWDYGSQLMPREIEYEIIKNARKLGVNEKTFIISSSRTQERLDARENPPHAYFKNLPYIISKFQFDICLLGLRAEESSKRKRKIKYNAEKPMFGCKVSYPIADFTWKDIWATIVDNDLPYLSFYDKYVELLGWNNARLVTFFDREFDKFGSSNVDGVLLWKYRFREK
jgi:3'-phosphoadenosine 5'-phosphosulfate sulfotransferase (PAPS reductase)/FAD synthetase